MPDCFNNDLPPPLPPAVAVQSNNEFRFQSVSGSPAFGSTGPWCSRRFLTCGASFVYIRVTCASV